MLMLHSQGSSSNTIVLPNAESNVDYTYVGYYLYIFEGTGIGQGRTVIGYDGASRTATLNVPWFGNLPDSSSIFFLRGYVTNPTSTSVDLPLKESIINGKYNNIEIFFSYGGGAGQIRKISNYNGATRTAVVSKKWDSIPNTQVFQCVITNNGFDYAVTSANFDGDVGWKPTNKNITYRIYYSSERVDFYAMNDEFLTRLVTIVDRKFPPTSGSDLHIFYETYNYDSGDDNILAIRDSSSSIFGELPTFRPEDKFDISTILKPSKTLMVGKYNDGEYKNIAVDEDGCLKVVECTPSEGTGEGELKKIVGINYDVDKNETPEDLWHMGSPYVFPSIPTILYVKSTNGNDNPVNVGAHSVVLEGLDEFYNEISEVIILNGTNEVPSTQEYFRLNDARVLTAGSDEENKGDIMVRGNKSGGGSFNLAKIVQKTNSSLASVYTVPSGKKGSITRFSVSSCLKNTENKLSEGISHLKVRKQGEVFISKHIMGIDESVVFPDPIPVPEKSDIRIIISKVNTNDELISGGFDLILKTIA